jgi:hypothetical protein
MEFEDFQRYRWFLTSSGKPVVGGKSALQNDELISRIKAERKEKIVMHTSAPSSPFTIILSDPKKVTEEDIKECAIFTASMSRAWKLGRKKAYVDIFRLSGLYKNKEMNLGSWGVKQKAKRIFVTISLVLTKQKSKLRAVPEDSVNIKKDILLKIVPGKFNKELMLAKIDMALDGEFTKEEILSALPPGGVRIRKP